MSMSKYLDDRLVLFLEQDSRDEAVAALAQRVEELGKLQDKAGFLSALLEREKIVSTGIGMGVAVPHAKLSSCKEFFIAIGIHKGRGIHWNALDGSPVRFVFLVGGPVNRQTEYLRILSSLTQAMKDEQRRKRLLRSVQPEEVVEAFAGC